MPLDVMPLNGVGHTFTVLRRPAGSFTLGKFLNILKFRVKEIDPSTGDLLCLWFHVACEVVFRVTSLWLFNIVGGSTHRVQNHRPSTANVLPTDCWTARVQG